MHETIMATLKHSAAVLAVGFMIVAGGAGAAWADEDHGGQDVTIVEDTVWTGDHTNIRTLIITERATLSAAPGATLRIEAQNVEVFGVLTADLAGNAGGQPGGRGRGGAGGAGAGAGAQGDDGSVCGRVDDYNAGGGGGGAGSFIGNGGNGGAGANANDGGCQGDDGGAGGGSTNTLTPRLGAGGGGGGGAGGRRHVPGTAGQAGGGLLILDIKSLRLEGRISADGGNGGTGGTSPDFFHGGGGGGGASGGTVQITTTYIFGGGVVAARGGNGGNGGQGDLVRGESFTGAGGGGGGGGLVILEFANNAAFTGQCQVGGGAPGTGENANGTPGPAGTAGQCVQREINGTPTATPGGPYIGVEGLPITLDGTQSIDPDGDPLTYAWDCDNNGDFEQAGPVVQCTFANDGTYPVRLRVRDPQGEEDTISANVVVTEGPPAASVTGPERVDENTLVNLDASASDGFGDDIVSYAWDFDYDGTFQADDTTETPTNQTTYCDNGVFTIAVQATDSGGSVALALHRVIVTNVAPSVTNEANSTATEGQPYTHTIEVSDPGCDEISYTFITRPEGMDIDNNGNIIFRPTFRQALEGQTLVRVLISDDDFGRFTYEWTLNVGFTDQDEDSLPDTWEQFFGLDPTNPTDSRQDPDGDGRDNIAEFNADTNPTEFDGPTRVRLSSPRDDTEVNLATPLLRAFRAQSPVNDDMRYEIELYDYVEDEAMLQPEMLVASVDDLVPDPNSPSLEWEVPESANLQDHTRYCWRARAVDSLVPGRWSELWCFFVNLANEAPEAPSILVPRDEENLDIGQPELTVSNCSDVDEDPLTYTFILYRGDGIATPVTSASGLPEGEDGMTSWQMDMELDENTQYCWRVQCRDNEGLASEYSDVACFFIDRENEAPSAPLIISPVAVDGAPVARVEEAPVQIVVRNSEDPEGNELIYRFQLDTSVNFDSNDFIEEEIGSGNRETTWSPEIEWEDNTTYFARVQAFDGSIASPFVAVEFFLNFENDPPTPPTLRSPVNNTLISSRQPTLTLVNAQDPDGDELQYTFEIFADSNLEIPIDRRGGVDQTPETTQYRITSTQLVDGTYYWRATANDGNAESAPSEVGVFIVRASGGSTGDPNDPNDPNNNTGDPNDPNDPDNPNTPPGGASDDGCGCVQTPTKTPLQHPAALLALALIGLIVVRRRQDR